MEILNREVGKREGKEIVFTSSLLNNIDRIRSVPCSSKNDGV